MDIRKYIKKREQAEQPECDDEVISLKKTLSVPPTVPDESVVIEYGSCDTSASSNIANASSAEKYNASREDMAKINHGR